MSPFASSIFCLIPLFTAEPHCQLFFSAHIFKSDTSPPLFPFFLSSCYLSALHLPFLNHQPSLKSPYSFPLRTAVRLPGVLVCCLSSTARLNPPKESDSLLLYQSPHTVRCPRLLVHFIKQRDKQTTDNTCTVANVLV